MANSWFGAFVPSVSLAIWSLWVSCSAVLLYIYGADRCAFVLFRYFQGRFSC